MRAWLGWTRRGVPGLLALCLGTAEGRSDVGGSLERARAAVARLDFPGALRETEAALAEGKALPEESEALYRLWAEVAAALGEKEKAVFAFGVMLALHPDFRLPEGASPRLEQPFVEAQRRAVGKALRVEVRSEAVGAGQVRSVLTLRGEGLAGVGGARLYVSEAGGFQPRPLSLQEGTHWRCAEAPCPHFVAALDAHGNELSRVGSPYAPLTVQGGEVAKTPTPTSGWLRPSAVLAASSVLATVGAVYFGREYLQKDRELANMEGNPTQVRFAQAQAVDAARRRDHAWMLVFAGVGLGAGGAAVVTW